MRLAPCGRDPESEPEEVRVRDWVAVGISLASLVVALSALYLTRLRRAKVRVVPGDHLNVYHLQEGNCGITMPISAVNTGARPSRSSSRWSRGDVDQTDPVPLRARPSGGIGPVEAGHLRGRGARLGRQSRSPDLDGAVRVHPLPSGRRPARVPALHRGASEQCVLQPQSGSRGGRSGSTTHNSGECCGCDPDPYEALPFVGIQRPGT
jgi:hypothetical protein